MSADDPVDVSLAQIGRDGDEQGDYGPVEVSVDAHDCRPVIGRFDLRDMRSKFLLADSARNVGVAHGVMRRQMDVASQMDRPAVVLSEEQPDRVKVVEVGFDPPVAPDRRAEALAADASTTVRDIEHELDPLLANRSDKVFAGADQLDVDHEQTVATRGRKRPLIFQRRGGHMCGHDPADVLMVEDDPGDALMVRESFGYRARPQRSIAIFSSDSFAEWR